MAVSFCGKRVILARSSLLKTPRRNGYIVLLPEIGDDLPDKNPLLKEDGFPEFNHITIEKCVATVAKQTVVYEDGLKQIEENVQKKENIDVFRDIINPLEEIGAPLTITWGLAKTLYVGNQSLMPTKSYMQIHERARKVMFTRFISIPMYEACKNAQKDTKLNLTEEQRRVVDKFVTEGKLNGLEVGKKTDVFNANGYRILERQEEFSKKLEVATKQFSHTVTDPNIMKDFPDDLLKFMAIDQKQPHRGPWKVTLEPYIKSSFLEYCPDRNLRWNVWQANNKLSAPFVEQLVETSTTLEHLRDKRADRAKFLGFKSYAEMSMQTKMAGSVENVMTMMDTLLERAKPAQIEEIQDLEEFAIGRGFNGEIQLWDLPYWARKQRRAVYGVDENLKEYFPLPHVLSGLFKLTEKLFGVHFVEQKTPDVWHKDVRFFDVIDSNGTEPIASFYLDPYTRQNDKIRVEESSGWMLTIQNRSTIAGTTPLAALVFNFQPPSEDKPSLLTLKDVHGLFTKFGYILQHLLTTANYSEVAGSSNVEWDAVEISGHFMSNWLYEQATLKDIGLHYKTGESLPSETIEGLTNVRSHLAGYNLCKEIYLSKLDLELHSSDKFWKDIAKPLWKSHLVFPLDAQDYHPCSFSAIFSGDWGAAYYSHLWAQMVAADAYSAFQEISPTNENQQAEVGKRYRDTFLSLGGGCHPSEVFRRFRGRDPSPIALLKNLGLKVQPRNS